MNEEEIKDFIKNNIEDFHQLLKKHRKKSDFILFATRKGLLDDLSIYLFFDRDRKSVIQDFNKIIEEYKKEKIAKNKIKREQEKLRKENSLRTQKQLEQERENRGNEILQEKYNLDIQHKFSNYRFNLGTSYTVWKQLENWMRFFIELGVYIQQIEKINLYVSYIDDEIPTVFLLLGILDSYYSEFILTNEDIKTLFKQKNEIVFYNSQEKAWRNTRNYNLEKLNINKKEELYLKVLYNRPKEEPITKYFPPNTWLNHVRLAGLYKGLPGRNDRIIVNDEISDFLISYYGQEKVSRIKLSNQILANVIGAGKARKIHKLNHLIEFSNEYDNFSANDIIYQDSKDYNNYHFRNVGIINSLTKKQSNNKKLVSIFLNSNNALKYESYKTNKNVYIVNRFKANKNLNDELFINQISKLNSTQEKLDAFYKILSEKEIEFPRGIELYEWK